MLSRLSLLRNYTSKQMTPLSLKNVYDYSVYPTERKYIKQSKFLHEEIPIRLAHRIDNIHRLPLEMINLSSLQRVENLYLDTFETLTKCPYPNNIENCNLFTEMCGKLKQKHKNIEKDIAKSVILYKNRHTDKYMENKILIDDILTQYYNSRIGVRFLVGQQLGMYNKDAGQIMKFKPGNIVKNCIYDINQIFAYNGLISPKMIIENYNEFEDENDKQEVESNNLITYLPNHIHYILLELLKNSAEAMISHKKNKDIKINLYTNSEDLVIQIKDNGQSFKRDKIKDVFSFGYTTSVNEVLNMENIDCISGYGHGLGLSRIYARYFGGDLLLTPIENYGTIATVYLKILGNNVETIADNRT